MIRNHQTIWKKINPKLEHDLHIHSNWSQDNLKGPSMEDWAKQGQKYGIHIGFADHFEMWYYKTQSKKYGTWKLTPETIEEYIEEFEQVKQFYPNISLGLEIDYCKTYSLQIQEFLDDYSKEFDFLIGSVHRLDSNKEITVYRDLRAILKELGSWGDLLSKYFATQFEMVNTNWFDGIAHPNVIFRFFSNDEVERKIVLKAQDFIKELAQKCLNNKVLLEVNLSGLLKPWQKSFPERELVNHLIVNESLLYIGSDSHQLDSFKHLITQIRQYNRVIRNEWLFDNKISL